MPLPIIDEQNRKKPLCYDPAHQKFIYFDDIVSGREKIVPVDILSPAELKILIIERHRAGPDYKVQAISGQPFSRDDVINAIERDEPFGRITVEAEKSHIRDLLKQIQDNI